MSNNKIHNVDTPNDQGQPRRGEDGDSTPVTSKVPENARQQSDPAVGCTALLGLRFRCKTKNLAIHVARRIWSAVTLGMIPWPKCLWYYDFTWLHQGVDQHNQSSRGQSKTPVL